MKTLLQANQDLIAQGIHLLSCMDNAKYTMPEKACFNASVGWHMRQVIEHYVCYVDGVHVGNIDYEARQHDKRLETERAYAIERLEAIGPDIIASMGLSPHRPLKVRVKVTALGASEDEQWAQSSPRRELEFVLNNTVHHYAFIGMIAQQLGVSVPQNFGVAPATMRYRVNDMREI